MLVTRLDIINYLIESRNYTSYLEIGMDDPTVNFIKVNCKVKESVDPYDTNSQFCTAWTDEKLAEFLGYLTYRMTSDDFFVAYPQKKYDLIFIDGLHMENQSDKDIYNALKHLNRGGVVVVHDCLPVSKESQIEENPSGDWVGTVWRSIVKYTLYSPCDVKVIDTDWGVGIVEYCDNMDFTIPECIDLDYDDFSSRKRELMPIYDWKQLRSIVNPYGIRSTFYPEKLRRITNVILSNLDTVHHNGLFHGKMGLVIYFFYLGKALGIKSFENTADKMLDSIMSNMEDSLSFDFGSGICGLGWTINQLIKDGFIRQADENVLDDIDQIVIQYFSKNRNNLIFTTTGLLYGIGRLEPSVKHIQSETKETLLKTINSELKYWIINYKNNGYASNQTWLQDFHITWHFPWLLWCVSQLKNYSITHDTSECLLQELLTHANSILKNRRINMGNRFFIHLILCKEGYRSSYKMFPIWSLVGDPSINKGLSGFNLLLKLFTDPLNYPELKQKLSERLTEFEDTENISGYRCEQSPNDYCLGLLNGVAGIGLSELL